MAALSSIPATVLRAQRTAAWNKITVLKTAFCEFVERYRDTGLRYHDSLTAPIAFTNCRKDEALTWLINDCRASFSDAGTSDEVRMLNDLSLLIYRSEVAVYRNPGSAKARELLLAADGARRKVEFEMKHMAKAIKGLQEWAYEFGDTDFTEAELAQVEERRVAWVNSLPKIRTLSRPDHFTDDDIEILLKPKQRPFGLREWSTSGESQDQCVSQVRDTSLTTKHNGQPRDACDNKTPYFKPSAARTCLKSAEIYHWTFFIPVYRALLRSI